MNKSVFDLDENIVSAVCYLTGGIFGIIVLVLERNNKTARFHAMQSVLFMLVSAVLLAVLRILTVIPLLGLLARFALSLTSGAVAIVFIALCLAVLLGKKIKLPILGEVAYNQVM